jgi:hypothetical protein
MRIDLLGSLMAVVMLAGVQRATAAPGTGDTEALMLDLSAHYGEIFVTPEHVNASFSTIAGRRMFDGVPFQMDGRASLYGKEVALDSRRSREAFPDIIGIKVGRAFDELHLLHTAQWSDVEGMTIARVHLNYADGTRHELDIGYGVHVRDWQRLQSEEHEAVTDANTKVVWRASGIEKFKASQRVFKSLLMNPFPSKRVDTIDFVSAGQIATYDIYAATVVNSDPGRPVTPPVPLDRPERKFDGRITVRVLDHLEHPVEGVWVYPDLSVPGSGWATVASPLYTSAEGTGVVKFPTDDTWCIVFNVRKEGWHPVSEQVNLNGDAASGGGVVVTFHLSPDPGTVADARLAGGQAPAASGTPGTAAAAVPQAAAAEAPAAVSGAFRPSPILMISAPVGSAVRIEYSDTLAPDDWKPLTTITIPASPYAFVCGQEEGPLPPQRFYRATAVSPQ